MPSIVRPATIGDAEAIGRLSAEFVAYLEGLGDSAVRGISAEEYRRAGFGERPAFAGLIVEDRGDPVGYLLYHEGYDIDQGGRVLHVIDLFVTANARGRGAGRALMDGAREACRRAGGVAVLWLVYPPNTAARAFYERLGGAYVGELVMSWRV
jgi:GNAT superfamily N-acetyltransferase